jgi:hypothetical protein
MKPWESTFQLTISGRVQHDKPRVHADRILASLPFHRVGVSAEPTVRLIQVHVVARRFQGPESRDARTAAADHGDFFAFDRIPHRKAVETVTLAGKLCVCKLPLGTEVTNKQRRYHAAEDDVEL